MIGVLTVFFGNNNMLGGTYIDRLFTYLLPEYCLGCQREGDIVCRTCVLSIEKPSIDALYTPSSDHMAMWRYEQGGLPAELVKAWKYRLQKKAFQYFIPAFQAFSVERGKWCAGIDMVVPIPLHKRRECERGFNQSARIAEEMSKVLSVPWGSILERARETKAQAKLSREEREKNMHEVFTLREGSAVLGKTFLLVDDVYTTGATMGEAARVLKAHGAKRVALFTLCKDELRGT
jgi:ComF family protein